MRKNNLQKNFNQSNDARISVLGSLFYEFHSSNYSVYYRAELYNLKLLEKEYSFNNKTASLGELLGSLYEKLGSSFVSKLDGKFSFILFDKNESKLLICRDIFGSYPLYLFNKESKLFFSFEISELTKKFETNFDYNFLAQYLTSNIISREQTSYLNIKRILPGRTTIYSENHLGKLVLKDKIRFWRPPIEDKNLSKEDSLYLLRDSFNNALENRLSLSSEVSVSLSGGLDSAIVFSWLRTKFPEVSLMPFTSSFSGFSCDETRKVDELLKYFNVSGKNISSHQSSKDFIQNEIRVFNDLANYPTGFYLNNLKKEVINSKFKYLFTGYGADEIFSANEEFSFFPSLQNIRNLSSGFFPSRLKSFLKNKRVISDWFCPWFTEKFKQETNIANTFKESSMKDFPYLSSAKQIACKDLFNGWAVFLREVEERSASQYSLSLQSPFLDKNFIESYFKIPSKYVWDRRFFEAKSETFKKLEREALAIYLPNTYSSSSNRAEFSEVAISVLKEQLEGEELSLIKLDELGWVDSKKLGESFKKFLKGDKTYSFWEFWPLLVTEKLIENSIRD